MCDCEYHMGFTSGGDANKPEDPSPGPSWEGLGAILFAGAVFVFLFLNALWGLGAAK